QAEKTIQRLLSDAGASGIGASFVSVDPKGFEVAADWDNLRSGENYLGYERTENFSASHVERGRRQTYSVPTRMALNQWALGGEWTIGGQAIALDNRSGKIAYRFHARDLHLVMGPSAPERSVRFRVTIDGQPPGAAHGGDVDDQGNGTVVDQ